MNLSVIRNSSLLIVCDFVDVIVIPALLSCPLFGYEFERILCKHRRHKVAFFDRHAVFSQLLFFIQGEKMCWISTDIIQGICRKVVSRVFSTTKLMFCSWNSVVLQILILGLQKTMCDILFGLSTGE